MIEVGKKAPKVQLKNAASKIITPTDMKGYVVLYFYPQDDTPGCTKQACSLRDGYSNLKKKRIQIFGISSDDEASHQAFTKKYDLPFELLVDNNHTIAKKYHAYGEKNLYGNIVIGVKRTTFILQDGVVVDIIKRPKNDDHANQILDRITKLEK